MDYVNQLIAATVQKLSARALPESTYRLQFHAGFGFADAARLNDYFHDLGITHVYASPYLKARAGSTHGYDVIDHDALNPELGSREDYGAWVQSLATHGLSHIFDMVPNHVGVATNDNRWWNDVLRHGQSSRYASFFDIAWSNPTRPDLNGKVLLPILSQPFGETLEQGQFRLLFDNSDFSLEYGNRRLPINPASSVPLFEMAAKVLSSAEAAPLSDDRRSGLEAFSTWLDGFKQATQAASAASGFGALYERSPAIQSAIQQTLISYNGSAGHPRSFDMLESLLSNQHYRLAHWRCASENMNYRRFFDINDFAAIRMEIPDAFQESHQLVFKLISEGIISGLRIDHPDGLFDPAGYLRQLQIENAMVGAERICVTDPAFVSVQWGEIHADLRRRLTQKLAIQTPDASSLYVVVEKILGTNEILPDDWPVHGTSGYDFLNKVSGLFVDPRGSETLSTIYQDFTGVTQLFPSIAHECRQFMLDEFFSSEFSSLTGQAYQLAQKTRAFRDITFSALFRHLRQLVVCLPVYRTYVIDGGVSRADIAALDTAIENARALDPDLHAFVLGFLRSMILLETPASFTPGDIALQRCFAAKFQQLTSPVFAKGVEDTAFYRYYRLASLNEVGGNPDLFGISQDDLHHYFIQRQRRWPHALSCLSTHDTKRSEDVRARIHVLSEIPDEWNIHIQKWKLVNPLHRGKADAMSANDEYLLYQTLIGTWPLGATQADEPYVQRIQEYMIKAAREAKADTAWIDANDAYEASLKQFVTATLTSQSFLPDFVSFVQRISDIGLFTSLSQTLLRLMAPGVPDTYQGSELWNFTLVDPDNRRPVDYTHRSRLLADVCGRFNDEPNRPEFIRELLNTRADGRVKLHLHTIALKLRRSHPGLFTQGDYIPLTAKGDRAENVFSFIRRLENHWVLVVVPRLLGALMESNNSLPIGEQLWQDTILEIPSDIPRFTSLRNLLTGRLLKASDSVMEIRLSDLFADFPVAIAEPLKESD